MTRKTLFVVCDGNNTPYPRDSILPENVRTITAYQENPFVDGNYTWHYWEVLVEFEDVSDIPVGNHYCWLTTDNDIPDWVGVVIQYAEGGFRSNDRLGFEEEYVPPVETTETINIVVDHRKGCGFVGEVGVPIKSSVGTICCPQCHTVVGNVTVS